MPPHLHVVVLAAGQGTRLQSAQPKVLHRVGGLPMLEHVLRASDALSPATTTVIIGHEADAVRAAMAARPDLRFVVQHPERGTADALRQAESALSGETGTVLLLRGDIPLVHPQTLRQLVETHATSQAAATVLTTAAGPISGMVEDRNLTAGERAIGDINTGIYAFALGPLWGALRGLANRRAQGEDDLSDLVGVYRTAQHPVASVHVAHADEVRGVDTRADLADLERLVRERKNRAVMLAGVTLIDPATTYLDEDVVIGADTVIEPGVQLQGRTRVGQRCTLHAGVRLTEATLADDVTVLDRSVIVQSTVGPGAAIGPFAHLRPDSTVGPNARIGNFVELKKTTMGEGSKANHLAYLGDATIGADVNIGAGTITCNYDGVAKHPTVIEDGVFIGSDSQLIAPVRVGKGAYVAAGSSITDNVPEDALAIARGRQENKPGWAARRRAERGRHTPAKKA